MKLWGISIEGITREEALHRLERPQLIFTPNPEILLEARRNPLFRRALQKGTLLLPDGHGLQLVSTLLKIRSKALRLLAYFPALFLFLFWKRAFVGEFPEVIHGSDFMDDVLHLAATRGLSVYFLGGREGAAEGTRDFFQRRYPRLKVAGFSSADPSKAAFEPVKVSKAQVLFVAYGAPKQELWLAEYFKQLPQVKYAMAVGGSFDFYSGKIRRAPGFMRKLGLEWLWRLLMNPFQRLQRIWRAVVIFPLLTIFE